MTLYLGIDPGPDCCGVCMYDLDDQRAMLPISDSPVAELLDNLRRGGTDLVAIERVQSYGIAGPDLLRTSEVVGRLYQRALDSGLRCRLVYRREVLRCLDVAGRGSHDSRVRQRLLEMHGGDRRSAVGTKKAPGPLYGVTGHAWQALAVAVTAADLEAVGLRPRDLDLAESAGLGCAT